MEKKKAKNVSQKRKRPASKVDPKKRIKLMEKENDIERKTLIEQMTSVPDEFEQFPLSTKTKKGLKKANFLKMTDIQKASILHALKGCDVVASAKTGSGKTLAFLIPLLEKLYNENWSRDLGPGVIIISPTHELASQIFRVINQIGKFHNFSVARLIGGPNIKNEAKNISVFNILICTPGRLLHHMNESPDFNCHNLQMLILDEADRVLDEKFKKEINSILEFLPKSKQTLLFSATMTKNVEELSRLNMKNPVRIAPHEKCKYSTPNRLTQGYVVCKLEEKINFVWSWFKLNEDRKAICFVSTCKQVRFFTELFSRLSPKSKIKGLHGNLKDFKRQMIFDEFIKKESGILFTTDVIARGIDITNIGYVLQLDCPEDADQYIHRSGRTARNDNKGMSLLVLMPSEKEAMLKELEKKKIPISEINVNSKTIVSISDNLAGIYSKEVEMNRVAQKAFYAYFHDMWLMKNKEIFKPSELNQEAFAKSMGLYCPPFMPFMLKDKSQIEKNPDEQLNLINKAGQKPNIQKVSASVPDVPKKIIFEGADEFSNQSNFFQGLLEMDLEKGLTAKADFKRVLKNIQNMEKEKSKHQQENDASKSESEDESEDSDNEAAESEDSDTEAAETENNNEDEDTEAENGSEDEEIEAEDNTNNDSEDEPMETENATVKSQHSSDEESDEEESKIEPNKQKKEKTKGQRFDTKELDEEKRDEIRQKFNEELNTKIETIDKLELKTGMPFSSLKGFLNDKMLRSLEENKFKEMMEIQAQTLPHFLHQKDIYAIAKTGSGKTLAFLIPVIETLSLFRFKNYMGAGAIIISPTNELARQTYDVLKKLICHHSQTCALLYGLNPRQVEIEKLVKRKASIIVCTPGRLLDHLKNTKDFVVDFLRVFVVDEMDKLFDMGFKKQLDQINALLPKSRLSMFFSATSDPGKEEVARRYSFQNNNQLVFINQNSDSITVDKCQQHYIVYKMEEKVDLLYSLIKMSNHKKLKTLVFMNNSDQVLFYSEFFNYIGVPVSCLHGKMENKERTSVLKSFRKVKSGTLLCTDLVARGLDIPDISIVFQYDLPKDSKVYVHRVGRTARANKEGLAYVLVHEYEMKFVNYIQLEKVPLEIGEFQGLEKIQDKLDSLVKNHKRLRKVAKIAANTWSSSYSHVERFSTQKIDEDLAARQFGLFRVYDKPKNLN